ncbi:MAG: hypothetical protein IJU44_04130 [Kiritimatiellae bacterium]|nr:hypothetical protein [Kiritimatiellia bacterium]
MGIFSDRCWALIDRTTGRALTGEALKEAQKDPRWPRCGTAVSKQARFCRSCGAPAPGGWWKCPACNKWIGNDARHCPHCNEPLYPEDRVAIAGGVWRKEPRLFAQRFEIGDVKRLLTQELLIQEGTLAIVMDGGRVCGLIESGRHNPDSLARKINWFGNPPPRSVVLVDVGEVIAPLHIEGLRTAEHFPIEFYGEAILRFKGDINAARSFTANVLKEQRSCEFSDLTMRLEPAIRGVVDEMCTTSTLDDLVRDPDRRIRLHEIITSRIKADLAACGLEAERVSSAEFTGDKYEEYAENLGQVDEERREIEYRAALRKLADQEAMDQYKDADALRSYKEIIDHEFRVSHETREREFALLKREWEHDDIKYRWLLELEKQEHDHVIDTNGHVHVNEINLLDANGRLDVTKVQAEIDRVVNDEKIDESKKWLEVRRLKMLLEQENKRLDAERRKNMTIEQMIADVEDPEVRSQLLEVFKLKIEQQRIERNVNMSPEQLLAELGQDPVNARLVAKMEELFHHAADREDKNLGKMLEPAVEAAKHPSIQNGPIIK